MPDDAFACWDESYAQTHEDGWVVDQTLSAGALPVNCIAVANGAALFIDVESDCLCAVDQ